MIFLLKFIWELNVVRKIIMKIRIGFVSNSSTCSFQIFGIMEETYEVMALLKEKGIILDDAEDHYKAMEEGEGRKLFDDKGLDIEFVHEDEYTTIGRDWSTIKDDETGKQFKDSIIAGIVEIFGEEKREKCSKQSGTYPC